MLVRFILATKALTDDTHSSLASSLVLLIQLGKNIRFCRSGYNVSQYWPCTYKATNRGASSHCHQGAKSCRSSSCAFFCCFLAMCRIWLLQTWDEQMQWRWSQSSRMCTFWASSCSPAVWEFKTAHIDILKVNWLCFWACVRLVTVWYQRSTSNVNMWAFFTSDCGGLIPHLPTLYNMTSSMLRRQLKNLVQNYSEAEVKVRIRILCTNSQCQDA